MAKGKDSKVQQCIRECDNAYEQAVITITHCLTLGGEHADSKHIKLLLDAAEVTKLTEGLMLRQSDFHADMADLCADVCDACADSCEEMGEDDEQMQKCAEACRKCADVCRAL